MLTSIASAAPPGETPFGVYDPPGDFVNDAEVEIEHLFLPWEDVFLPSLFEADQYALDRQRAILVTIEPWTWTRSERNTPARLIAGIESGEYDFYMRDICTVLGEMESPITVRWAQEMDDYTTQFIWAGWKPETYISAFQKMIDICREVAPDINVMWSPLGYENMAEYYPGDEYVDLVGLSVFGLQPWEETILDQAQSFVDILEPRYERAQQFGKPIVVAELGYVGSESYVESWDNTVRQSFEQFPDLVGVIYFNQKEVYPWPDDFGLPDWRFSERALSLN
ncbi:MAG: glycosyl hydrolase [Rhodobacter sp.]|nr:glycosyl hydrolase [Rhodobacter sp.]